MIIVTLFARSTRRRLDPRVALPPADSSKHLPSKETMSTFCLVAPAGLAAPYGDPARRYPAFS